MCGLVGLFHNEPHHKSKNYRKIFDEMLYADALRGMDSTGVALCHDRISNKAEDVLSLKKAMNSSDFINLRQYNNLMDEAILYKYWMGHNRSATRGVVNSINAHPFQHGDIIGSHNGTLYEWNGLNKNKKFTVDSEAIMYALSKRPTVDVLEEIDGAFALMWYDRSTGKAYTAKNDERPLYMVSSKDEKLVIIASESNMLNWIATRNKVKYDNVYELTEGVLWEFDNDDPREVKSTNFKPKETYQTYGWGRGRWNSSYEGYSDAAVDDEDLKVGDEVIMHVSSDPVYNDKTSLWSVEGYSWDEPYPHVRTQISSSNKDVNPEMINKDDMIKGNVISVTKKNLQISVLISNIKIVPSDIIGPDGTNITKQEWDELTDKGCCVCSTNIFSSESWETDWTTDNQPICSSCSKENFSN